MICEWCCRAIERAFKEPEAHLPHHLFPASFIAAVHQNCRICVRLLRCSADGRESADNPYRDLFLDPKSDGSLSTSVPSNDLFLDSGTDEGFSTARLEQKWEDFRDRTGPKHLTITVERTKRYFGPGYKNIVFFSLVPSQDLEQNTVLITEVPSRTSMHTSLPIVKYWYDNYLTNHLVCNKKRALHSLPSRVLDITSHVQGYVRLVDTASETIQGTYMTLSHKWRTKQSIRLTGETESKLKNKFLVTELPKTFYEAVKVAASLGVLYLWIDSLCIKQDSIDDWEIESSRMGDIYKSAQCNIGATGANDNTEGLFFERDVSQLFLDLDLDKEPLNHRAWVFQERWLAPSMIHFAKSQLFWEYHEMTACELFPERFPACFKFLSWFKDIPDVTRTYSQAANTNGISIEDPVISGLELWSELSIRYAACSLTREEDKLTALSGLVKEFQRMVEAEYIAGLWNRHIVPQHLWQLHPGGGHRPSTYRAPSWSWASVEGSFLSMTSGRLSGNLVEVIDAKVVQAGLDPTGAVLSGYLKLQGDIHSIRIVCEGNLFFIEGLAAWRQLALIDAELRPEELERSYFCMPVQEYFAQHSHIIKGLILDCIDTVQSSFKRIGVFSVAASNHLELRSLPETYSTKIITIV